MSVSAENLTSNVDYRSLLLARVRKFPDHKPVATWSPVYIEDRPLPPPDIPLSSRQRDLLNTLRDLIVDASGQIDQGCRQVRFQEMSGFTDSDLNSIANACGGLISKIDLRLSIDVAARMKAVRQSPLTRLCAERAA